MVPVIVTVLSGFWMVVKGVVVVYPPPPKMPQGSHPPNPPNPPKPSKPANAEPAVTNVRMATPNKAFNRRIGSRVGRIVFIFFRWLKIVSPAATALSKVRNKFFPRGWVIFTELFGKSTRHSLKHTFASIR